MLQLCLQPSIVRQHVIHTKHTAATLRITGLDRLGSGKMIIVDPQINNISTSRPDQRLICDKSVDEVGVLGEVLFICRTTNTSTACQISSQQTGQWMSLI